MATLNPFALPITASTWLFSSGPVGCPDPKPEGDPQGIGELVATVRAREHRIFAGRLDLEQLGMGERLIVAAVRAPDGDLRDWEALSAWRRRSRGSCRRPSPAS